MIRIMLDPGHAGKNYNPSPVVSGYYESETMWNLTNKLKVELEKYGFEVGLTRSTMNEDPELTMRGRSAKGYDLFISMHSNAASSEAPDAPWMIHFVNDTKTLIDDQSRNFAELLGPVVSATMGVSAPFYYTKPVDFDRDGNGYVDDEYYGVLFGAKLVGVPGIIIEHSFHTNIKATTWLMDDANLQRLAEAEAKALANYYGYTKVEDKPNIRVESETTPVNDKSIENRVAKLEDIIEEYEDNNVYDNAATKWDKINTLPDWALPTIKKLIDRGILKGTGGSSYNLNETLVRTMVLLDRAGMFDK